MKTETYNVYKVNDTREKIKGVEMAHGLIKNIKNGLYYQIEELTFIRKKRESLRFGYKNIWIELREYFNYKIIYLPSISIKHLKGIDSAIDIEFALLMFSITLRIIINRFNLFKVINLLKKK